MKIIILLSLIMLLGLSGASFAQSTNSVSFIQLSDTHWGFNNPKMNPDFAGTLKKAVTQINALPNTPDFIIFTGDETHTTPDVAIRSQRMTEFKEIIAPLKVKNIKFLPGEHDAALDNAQTYQQFFGETHYTFDLKGVHFVALDNVSRPDSGLGPDQLDWLKGVLAHFAKDSPIILFAHRPLKDVYAAWDWRTKDGAQAMDLLKPFKHVTLFYGHIHQERTDTEEGFTQYAAQGMMFALPAPGSREKPDQVPWDPDQPYRGLGFRMVTINPATKAIERTEYSIKPDASAVSLKSNQTTVKIVAKQFEFSPAVVHLKRNIPVVLELTTLDAIHGFASPDLNIVGQILPNQTTKISFTPTKNGQFAYFCDIFCGDGHEDMSGRIIVED